MVTPKMRQFYQTRCLILVVVPFRRKSWVMCGLRVGLGTVDATVSCQSRGKGI